MRNSLVTERDCCEYNCIWHASSLLSLFLTIKYLRQHFCFRTSFSRVDYFRNSKLYVRSSRRALWGSHSFSNRDQNAISERKNRSSRFDVLVAKNLVPSARYRTFWKLSSKHLKSRKSLPVSIGRLCDWCCRTWQWRIFERSECNNSMIDMHDFNSNDLLF